MVEKIENGLQINSKVNATNLEDMLTQPNPLLEITHPVTMNGKNYLEIDDIS